MKRRRLLASLGAAVATASSGCASNGTRPAESNDERPNESAPQRVCYDVFELTLIRLEDRVDWAETEAPVVESTDDRIAEVAPLQDALSRAVESEGFVPYEYTGTEFDAVRAVYTETDLADETELDTTISSLPNDSLPDVPSGPYIKHEGDRFAVHLDTWRQCDE